MAKNNAQQAPVVTSNHVERHADISPVDFSLDPFGGLGYTYSGKPILDQAGIIDHITSGRSLNVSNNVITYTFLDKSHLVGLYNNPNYGFTAGYGLSTYSPEQMAAARASVQLWDDLIPQTFKETNGMGADIVYANSLDPAQAYAYYPGSKGWKFQSDVFTNDPNNPTDGNWTNKWFANLGYGKTTLIHETGHALGLSHPGAYNYSPNVPQTYAGLAEYAQDSMQYSIMSYWNASSTGSRIVNWNVLLTVGYPQTPLLHDILAIQSIYGADLTTRVGDTVYGFHSNAGNAVYDFASNPFPYLSIYDAGGVDTLDLSGFTQSQFIDLHQGAFSSIGAGPPSAASVNAARAELAVTSAGELPPSNYSQAQIDSIFNSYAAGHGTAIAGDQAYLGQPSVSGINTAEYQNVSIAYGTIIENAIGGSGRDLIHGNEVDNILQGMGGNDVIRGFEGNDTLIGGAGNDTLTGGAGNDTFKFALPELNDLITDFGEGDKIDLSGLGSSLHYIAGAFTGAAGEVHVVGTQVSADLNGDAVADFIVTLQAGAVVHPDQIVLHA